jgi:Ca-activated chloride channel family protein
MRAVSNYQPSSVLEFSSKVVRIDSPITMRVDSLSTPQKIVQVKATVPRRGLAMVNAIGVQPSQSTTFAAKSRASAVPVESLHRIAPQLKPPNAAAYPDMYFKSSGVNPFLDTEDEHLSTFAMDVDTASYSITRRYLTEGHLPPSEAVRVEEFVNAFKYDYAAPIDDAFAIHLEGAPSIFADSKRTHLLRIGLKGRVIPDEDRKDAALTFVVDVSGSMERENRLGLVKKALTLLVDQLRPTDKVGIVVYGSQGRLVLPHTGVNRRAEILAAIDSLYPGGSTNAEEGLRIGYDLAWRNAEVDRINRVILCSDGVANVGQTGPDDILTEIRAHVKRGVTLSTVGFGMGNYNDILMEKLANAGNGNYAYVDTLSEARRIFVEDLTGTLQVIAKDAKIQVDFNPEVVSRFRLLGYENRFLENHQFRDDTVDAGEVGSGHSVTALYEVKLHEGASGKIATASIRYADPDNQKVTEIGEDILMSQLHESFEAGSAPFRLTAAVAEFAEILRESYWAKDGSLEGVRRVVKSVYPELDNEQVVELIYLLGKAIDYKSQLDS